MWVEIVNEFLTFELHSVFVEDKLIIQNALLVKLRNVISIHKMK